MPDDVSIEYNPGPDEPTSDIEAVKLRHEDDLLLRPNVTGVGLGQNAIGEDAIIVYLLEKSAAAGLPRELEGYEVMVEITGPIDAY